MSSRWLTVDAPILFGDRSEAGRELAQALRRHALGDAVVVGLARGGVVIAAEVATALGLPLDAVAVRKVRHPFQPEYAIGAVAPGDGVYLRGDDGLEERERAAAVAEAKRAAAELDGRFHRTRRPLDLTGRTVVLADDGLATGATMIAAIRWARARGAARVVAAVPVGASQTAEQLRSETDEVVCLHAPEQFVAVGLWYEVFEQVDDAEVLRLLETANAEPRRAAVRSDGDREHP